MKLKLINTSDLCVSVYNPNTCQNLNIVPKGCIEVIAYKQEEVEYYKKGYRVFGVVVQLIEEKKPNKEGKKIIFRPVAKPVVKKEPKVEEAPVEVSVAEEPKVEEAPVVAEEVKSEEQPKRRTRKNSL